MENAPLCKFCGKPMEHNWCGMDEYYSCDCEGQKHAYELKQQIGKLEELLYDKKTELENYVNNNLYNTKVRNLKNQIKELESQYHNSIE